jgi:hypothetical protein
MKAIPDDVRRFVLTSIPSVPYLEAALLLYRGRGKVYSAADVARELYMTERAAADLLQALVDAGIVSAAPEGTDRYHYAPRDEAIGTAVSRLADVYAADLVGVAKLIHDATQKNAQRFADAFKLRKDR